MPKTSTRGDLRFDRLSLRRISVAAFVTATLFASALPGSVAAATFSARAFITPREDYLGDYARPLTVTVRNTGGTIVRAVDITRPNGQWSVNSCSGAPLGWSTTTLSNRCRFTSGQGGGIAPGAGHNFKLLVSTTPGVQDRSGLWTVLVSQTTSFAIASDVKRSSDPQSQLLSTAYSLQILSAIFTAGPATIGAACPAPGPKPFKGSAGNTLVICGRNRSTVTLTPKPALAALKGNFVTGYGGFASGPVAPSTGSRVLGNFLNVSITPTPYASNLIVPLIGATTSQTSPYTTLSGYSALNAAPNLSTSAGSTAYTEQAPGVVIDGALNVSDPDDAFLESAQIKINNAGHVAGDLLSFTNTPAITGSFSSGPGLLTLTGHATVGAYRTALRSVKFSSPSDTPGASRQITFSVNDGDTNSNTATAVKSITVTDVDDTPGALADPGGVATSADYTATAGVPIDISAGIGVLNNDTLSGATISGFGAVTGTEQTTLGTTTATAQGGLVTLYANGSFRYQPLSTPPIGGTDTFKYTITNSSGSSTATVTIAVQNQIIFVDDSASAGGDGTQLRPFDAITDLPAGRATGGVIYLFSGSYTRFDGDTIAGITLKNGEVLLGQGVALNTSLPFTLAAHSIGGQPSAGTAPNLSNSNGGAHGVSLATGNTIKGLVVGTATGAAIGGSDFGTLTVGSLSINTTGQALDLNTGTLSGNFTSITSTGGYHNISLIAVGTAATTSLGDNTGGLSGATDIGLLISAGSGSLTYASNVANSTAAAVDVDSMFDASVTLSGRINATSGSSGIRVYNNNSNTTITFSGDQKNISTDTQIGVSFTSNSPSTTVVFSGGGLNIDTTSGTGFSAAGDGIITVSGSGNVIDTGSGVGLVIATTTIGAGGVTFEHVSTNGATNGIVLSNTGTTAGLTLTGDSGSTANGSGGTIQNTTGDAVSLANTASVSLDQIVVANSANHGINGSGVTGFSLTNSLISGAGDGAGEHGMFVTNLLGTGTIDNTSITNSQTNNLRLINSASTAGSVTISDSTFSVTDSTIGSDAVYVATTSTANLTVNLSDNNDLNNSRDSGLQASASQTSTLRVTVTGTNSDYNGNLGSAVAISAEDTATVHALVQNLSNVSTGTSSANGSSPISILGVGASLINATVQGNSITNTFGNIVFAAIDILQDGNGTINANVSNNLITTFTNNGISAQGLGGTGVTGGHLNVTIGTSNSVSSAVVSALDGIRIEAGSNSGTDVNAVCLNMLNNNSSATGAGQQGYRLRKRASATFQLQNFVGNGAITGDVTTWVNTTKTNVGTTDIVLDGGSFSAVANCTTATLP